MLNAYSRKVARFQKKHGEGAYNHVLHALALLSAIPPLCFLTVDLNRYQEYSALNHVQNRTSLVLDAVGIAFVLLTVLWDLLLLTIPRDSAIPSWIIAGMDFVLSVSVTAISEQIFSNRTASGKCVPQLGECTTSALGLMSGTAGLLILTSIPHHTLWTTAVSRYHARRKERKKMKSERNSNPADKDGAISFENEIVP